MVKSAKNEKYAVLLECLACKREWSQKDGAWERLAECSPALAYFLSRLLQMMDERESSSLFPLEATSWCGAGYHDSCSLIKNPACVLEDEWANIPDWRTAWPSWYEWIGEDGAEAEAGRLRWGARSESWEEYKGSAALFSFSGGKELLCTVGGCCPLMGTGPQFLFVQ